MVRRVVPPADPNFISQADASRRWKVTRKTITKLKQRGEIVIRASDGKVDVVASETILAARPKSYRGGYTAVFLPGRDLEPKDVTRRTKGNKKKRQPGNTQKRDEN